MNWEKILSDIDSDEKLNDRLLSVLLEKNLIGDSVVRRHSRCTASLVVLK